MAPLNQNHSPFDCWKAVQCGQHTAWGPEWLVILVYELWIFHCDGLGPLVLAQRVHITWCRKTTALHNLTQRYGCEHMWLMKLMVHSCKGGFGPEQFTLGEDAIDSMQFLLLVLLDESAPCSWWQCLGHLVIRGGRLRRSSTCCCSSRWRRWCNRLVGGSPILAT